MNWHLKILTAVIIVLSSTPQVFAAYTPTEGRISYLAGMMINTNFQESITNSLDSQMKLGRSQSIALLLQALGDINTKGSLMAEVSFGMHKFIKEEGLNLDEYKFEAISLDLGYRRRASQDIWVSAGIGSMYPWKITQKIESRPTEHDEADFRSLYSFIVGFQYESEINKKPVSYDFRLRKYLSSQIDDQVALSFSLGYRFGI